MQSAQIFLVYHTQGPAAGAGHRTTRSASIAYWWSTATGMERNVYLNNVGLSCVVLRPRPVRRITRLHDLRCTSPPAYIGELFASIIL